MEVSGAAFPTAWKTSLIFEEFSDEPQTSEQIHAALCAKYGATLAVPPLRSVQSALSAHGEKKGGGAKIRRGHQVLWVRAGFAITIAASLPVKAVIGIVLSAVGTGLTFRAAAQGWFGSAAAPAAAS